MPAILFRDDCVLQSGPFSEKLPVGFPDIDRSFLSYSSERHVRLGDDGDAAGDVTTVF